jgi:hypothetical protein
VTGKPNEVGSQTLSVYSPTSFKIVANHNKNLVDPTVPPGKIKSYPCIQRNYSSRPVDSFTTLTATWSTNYPNIGEWDGAFDIWLGAWGNILGELMVWTHNRYNGPLPPKNAIESTSASIDGNTFVAWRRPLNPNDSRWYVALSMTNPKPEGTLDLVSVFRWLAGKGWLKATDLIAAVEYGVEIAHTGGVEGTFLVDYTLQDS